MRKKLVGTLLIAAMTASTLAGCGSSNSTAGTSASGGAAETSPAESATEAEGTDAADGEEVLTVWCWESQSFNVYAMKQAEAIYQKDHPILNWTFRRRFTPILSRTSLPLLRPIIMTHCRTFS